MERALQWTLPSSSEAFKRRLVYSVTVIISEVCDKESVSSESMHCQSHDTKGGTKGGLMILVYFLTVCDNNLATIRKSGSTTTTV